MLRFSKFAFYCVFCMSQLSRSCADETRAQQSLSCAHASVFAALVASGKDVTMPDVITAFPEEFRRNTTPIPMVVVRDVLIGFGLDASCVRFDQSTISRRYESSILLLQSNLESPGHFVFLKRVRVDGVVIIDPTSLAGERFVPYEQLSSLWNGEAISIGRRSFDLMASYSMAILGTLVVFLIWSEVSAKFSRSRGIMPLIFAGIFLGGCRESPATLPVAVEFLVPFVKVERLLEGGTHVIEVELKVGSQPTTIESVQSSCTCLAVDSSIAGRTLEKGTVLVLNVTISPGDKIAINSDLLVRTVEGATALVNISGVVERLPRAVQPFVNCEYTAGLPPPQGTVILRRTIPKNASSPPPELTVVHGERVDLEFANVLERPLKSTPGGMVYQEDAVWTWKMKEVPSQKAEEILVIPFKTSEAELASVTFRYLQVSPLHGLPESIYVGELTANETLVRDLRVFSTGGRSVIAAQSDSSDVECSIGDMEDGVQLVALTIVAPCVPGKFSRSVTFVISDISSPFVLTVLGKTRSHDDRIKSTKE